MDKNEPIRVFLSYAREDYNLVKQFYDKFKEEGIKPWMDKKDLLPGKLWDIEIRKEIKETDFFILFLTRQSSTKRGFIRKEIMFALDAWNEKLLDDIFLIPIRLQRCKVPDELSSLQYVDIFKIKEINERGENYQKLLKAIELGAQKLGKKPFNTLQNESYQEVNNYSNGQLDPKEQLHNELEMKTEDTNLGQYYSNFWNLARKYYIVTYRPKGNPDFPETLEALVRAASAPPNTDMELISWPNMNENALNQDQRRIWNFAKKIYSIHLEEYTEYIYLYCDIHPVEDAIKFHDARGYLAEYWEKWPPLVGYKFIKDRYTTRREIIILLAWLDLALVQCTRRMGKHRQNLYNLALKFDESKP